MDNQSGNDNQANKKDERYQDRRQNSARPNEAGIGGRNGGRSGDGNDGSNNGGANSQLSAADILFKDKVRLPAANDKNAKEPPIGVAQMKDNETIVLHIKGKTGDLSGEAEVEYNLGDKLYDEVYRHLGGIKKGETKLVPAWLDDPNAKQGQKPARQSTTDGPKTAEQEPIREPVKEPPLEPNKDKKADPPEKSTDKATDKPNDKPVDKSADKPADTALDKTGTALDVVIPPSPSFVATVNDTYGKMSAEVHDLLDKDKTVVTPTRRITDALPELKGQKPRGWPPGLTWDAVDGAYSPSRNLVVVAEETRDTSNNWVKSHRTEDVTRHEVGHATDYAMGKFSDTKEYIQAYEDDTKAMPAALTGTLKYFLQTGDGGKEEAFAEGVAAREGGSTSGKVFDSGFAKSIAVINTALLRYRSKLNLPSNANGTSTGGTPSTSGKPDGHL